MARCHELKNPFPASDINLNSFKPFMVIPFPLPVASAPPDTWSPRVQPRHSLFQVGPETLVVQMAPLIRVSLILLNQFNLPQALSHTPPSQNPVGASGAHHHQPPVPLLFTTHSPTDLGNPACTLQDRWFWASVQFSSAGVLGKAGSPKA